LIFLDKEKQPLKWPQAFRWAQDWQWKRAPEAYIDEDIIICSTSHYKDTTNYYPSQHKEEIITDLIRIHDQKSALEFIKQWGPLGINAGVKSYNELKATVYAVIGYEFEKNYGKDKDKNCIEFGLLAETIIKNYFKSFDNIVVGTSHFPGSMRDLVFRAGSKLIYVNLKGDYLENIYLYATRVKIISDMKRILSLCNEDPSAAEFEAELWWSNNYDSFLFESDKMFFPKIINPNKLESQTYIELLRYKFVSLRRHFNTFKRQGIYISFTPSGQPTLNFDGLHHFIDFILLSSDEKYSLLFPLKCADPKCKQLFFPKRKNQKYCPPLPWETRSRCEQRHGQQVRREVKKKNREN